MDSIRLNVASDDHEQLEHLERRIMRMYLISDIHIECGNEAPALLEEVDVIILAGDIARGVDSLDVAQSYRDACGVPVILLAGNHEYYRKEIKSTLAQLRAGAAAMDGIYFLENDTIVLNDVRFLGCTLWSNFSLYGEERAALQAELASRYVNDFNYIRCGKRSFTPSDVVKRFNASYAWLESELAKPFAGRTVVVTHFAPHRAAIHADYLGPPPDKITPYFVTDCSALMRQYPMAAWLYGHTHNAVDVIVENGVRLVSNQRGYPNEGWSYTKFEPTKVIKL